MCMDVSGVEGEVGTIESKRESGPKRSTLLHLTCSKRKAQHPEAQRTAKFAGVVNRGTVQAASPIVLL